MCVCVWMLGSEVGGFVKSDVLILYTYLVTCLLLTFLLTVMINRHIEIMEAEIV